MRPFILLLITAAFVFASPPAFAVPVPSIGDIVHVETMICDTPDQVRALILVNQEKSPHDAFLAYQEMNKKLNALGDPTCSVQEVVGIVLTISDAGDTTGEGGNAFRTWVIDIRLPDQDDKHYSILWTDQISPIKNNTDAPVSAHGRSA